MQEDFNRELWEICKELKEIKSIKNDYFLYMSAILYIKYLHKENNQFLEDLNYLEKIVPYELIYLLECSLKDIRKKATIDALFVDVNFRKILYKDQVEYFKKVIVKLCDFLRIIKRDNNIKISKAYEYLIMRTVQNNDLKYSKEEYYTPKGVVKTMIKLLDIKPQSSVYNPASNFGEFLIEADKQSDIVLIGEEENFSNYSICLTNLLLHRLDKKYLLNEKDYNDENALMQYINENTLMLYNQYMHEIKKVDYAIANPPFSEDSKLYLNYKLPFTSSIYSLYLMKMIENLKENGKMAIILPTGVLVRENEKILRELLLKENLIDAIINLPNNLFYESKVSSIILVISKNRDRNDILFIDASNEFEKKRKTNILKVENQDRISQIYKNYIQIDGISYVANINEIIENHFNLNIRKYIKVRLDKEEINRQELIESIDKLEEKRKKIQEEIRKIIYK